MSPRHYVYAEHVRSSKGRIGGWKTRGSCACGWKGTPRFDPTDAARDALAHSHEGTFLFAGKGPERVVDLRQHGMVSTLVVDVS